jgi:hypothetical protein
MFKIVKEIKIIALLPLPQSGEDLSVVAVTNMDSAHAL